jgi:hypothetical protein
VRAWSGELGFLILIFEILTTMAREPIIVDNESMDFIKFLEAVSIIV